MGRGLSKLQTDILKFAAKRPMAHYAELLKHLFGWEPTKYKFTYEDGRFRPSGQFFSKKEIGAKRYRSNMASLSRACVRLEHRGLVVIYSATISHWSAVKITDAGRIVVDSPQKIEESQPISLTVDSPQKIGESQPLARNG
jgi:hypothetical protein